MRAVPAQSTVAVVTAKTPPEWARIRMASLFGGVPTNALVLAALPLLPVVAVVGRRIAALVMSGYGERVLGAGLSVTIWLIAVDAAARVSGDARMGILIGMAAVALLFFVLPRPAAPADGLQRLEWRFVARGTVVIAPALIFWGFHDKLDAIFSHFSMASEIANGIYPPRDIYFPDQYLRYHYGVDLLFAAVSLALDIRIDLATIVVTAGMYVLYLALLIVLGRRLGGPVAAWPMMLLGAFAGGIPWLAYQGGRPLSHILAGVFSVPHSSAFSSGPDGIINPTLASYFFQPPFTVGLPLSVLVLVATTETGWRRAAGVAPGLAALSFSNTTMFLILSVGLVATEGARVASLLMRERRFAPDLWLFGALACGACAFMLTSGFTTIIFAKSGTAGSALMIRTNSGLPAGYLGAVAQWLLASMGLVLPLGLVSLRRAGPLAGPIGWGAVLAIAVYLMFEYRHSWDIVKFVTAATFLLAIPSALAIAGMGRRHWRYAALTLCIIAGLAFHLPFFVNLNDISSYAAPAALRVRELGSVPDEAAAITWLRQRIGGGEGVLVERERSRRMAYWGGFPQAWIDERAADFSFPAEWIAEREGLTRAMAEEPAPWQAAGMRWAIVADGEHLADLADRWVEAGEASEQARFGHVRVIRLGPRLN